MGGTKGLRKQMKSNETDTICHAGLAYNFGFVILHDKQ